MPNTIFSVAAFFLLIISCFIISKNFRKRLSREEQLVRHHKKRRTFLRSKVRQLFEIEKKHQLNLKVLEGEVEQLQQDIAIKHSNSRL
ncbi:MAG: hypothetical protein EOO96_02360 [Pedobacter sp.]|nr:MAG: hypothetical protein EOO96_02360 [Pedobacter sp.]